MTIVSLTQEGSDLKAKVLGFWSDLEYITTEGLSEQEKTLLIGLSRKIRSGLDDALDFGGDKS